MSEPPRRKVKPPSTSTRPAPVAAEAAARSAEPASQKAGDSAAAPAADTIPATEAPTAGEPPAASVDAAPGEAPPAAAAPAEPAGTPASRDDGAPSEQASNSLTAVKTFDAESNNAAAVAAPADNASAAPGEASPAATAPAEPAGTPAEQASAMADGLSPEQASNSFPVVETFDTESSNAAAADAAPADREPAAVAATSVAAAAAQSAAAPVAEAAPDASEFPAEKAAPASKQEDAPAAPVRKVKGPKVKAPTGALTPATQSVVEDDTPWYGEWQEPDAASEPASQVALGVPVEKLKVDPTPVIPPPRKALKTSEAPRGRSPNRPPERAGIPASHKALAAVAALVVLCGLVFVRPGASQSKPLVKSPVHIVIAMDKKIKPDSRILYEFPEAEFKVQRSVKEIKSGKELVLQAEVEGKAAPTYCMVTFFHANKKPTGAKKIELTGTPLEGRYP